MRRRRSMLYKAIYGNDHKKVFEVQEETYHIPNGQITLRIAPVLDWRKISKPKGKRKDDPDFIVPCTHLNAWGQIVDHNWKRHYPTVTFVSTIKTKIGLSHRIIESVHDKCTSPTFAHKHEMRLYELDDNISDEFEKEVSKAFRAVLKDYGKWNLYDRGFVNRMMVRFVIERCNVKTMKREDFGDGFMLADMFAEYFKNFWTERDNKDKPKPIQDQITDGSYIDFINADNCLPLSNKGEEEEHVLFELKGAESISDTYSVMKIHNKDILEFLLPVPTHTVYRYLELFANMEQPVVNRMIYHVSNGKIVSGALYSNSIISGIRIITPGDKVTVCVVSMLGKIYTGEVYNIIAKSANTKSGVVMNEQL